MPLSLRQRWTLFKLRSSFARLRRNSSRANGIIRDLRKMHRLDALSTREFYLRLNAASSLLRSCDAQIQDLRNQLALAESVRQRRLQTSSVSRRRSLIDYELFNSTEFPP